MRLLLVLHRDKIPDSCLKVTVLSQSFSNPLISLFKEDKKRELFNLLQANALAQWHVPSNHWLYGQIMTIVEKRYGLRSFYQDLVLKICSSKG